MMMRIALLIVAFLIGACASQPPVTPTAPTQPAPTLAPATATAPPSATATQPPATLTPAPTASAAPTAPAGQRPSFTLDVEELASGFTRPLYLTYVDDDSGRLFVVEQGGRIWIVEDGQMSAEPFLDITPLVNSSANERGLLSIAFHPDYVSNGFFFVNYTRQPDGATVIARYTVSSDPDLADPDSATTILTVDQPEPNHNGGLLKFGPDGYLYIGMGDGGGAGDRHGATGNGQNLNALLGKLLRIDVTRGEPYSIPDSNPFANRQDARPEIWAFGLRNPWRFSFDRATHDLYIADVGQNQSEEVNFQPASSPGGENYGWRIMEGLHCFSPSENCDQTGLVLPVAEYDHDFGCSVTGGYVYRGSQYPWLVGLYFFADYCTGIVWTSERDAAGQWVTTQQTDLDLRVSSFGEDEAGEMYVVGLDTGTVYRLTSTSP